MFWGLIQTNAFGDVGHFYPFQEFDSKGILTAEAARGHPTL